MARQSSAPPQVLADQVHSFAIHLLRKLRREDASSGLSAPRLSALSVMVFGGQVTLGALAAAEQVRPPTMTRIIDALEAQGLVTRSKNSLDGRSTLLSATSAGKKLLLQGRERRVRALSAQLETLTAKDRALVEAAITVLRAAVQAM